MLHHDRDYEPNTNVMQPQGEITDVKTLAERCLWARERAGMTQQELADRAGLKAQATIGNIEAGTRKKPRDLIAIAGALGVRPEWLSSGQLPISAIPPQSRSGFDLGHLASHSRNYSDPPRLQWGDLMGADLSQPFELEVIDGAFGADIPPGCVMRLDPLREPRGGWPALVRDSGGVFYLRDYQLGAGDGWQAVARVRGFAPLDSVADGLTVIAVMRGVDYP